MYFQKSALPEPVRFALKGLVVVAGGNHTPVFRSCRRMIEVECSTPPPVGSELFLISSRDLDLKAVKAASFLHMS